ncbi:hypothetical protein [Acinetobacter brisouii]|uniref:hypothetical protein n=1 Tax=Acinetobacter brisouii TaxID=396323 RepID=UPI00124EDFF6|nr:hypothetical protein [Acinetobacter brisouii]
MKVITRQEANLTTWLLSQVSLLESQTGKSIQSLELTYSPEGGVGVDLVFVSDNATETTPA